MGKEEFKAFVKENPKLIKYVQDGTSTWQQFYQIYDLYGNDKNAWKDYLDFETPTNTTNMNDVFNFFKNINLDSLQAGVNSIQRVLGLLGDLSIKDNKTTTQEYKPRPIYKHFED